MATAADSSRVARDSHLAAHTAGLRHVSVETPGLRRLRQGRGFRYVDPEGRAVRDPETLRRIASLVIPPAWTDVWICADAQGHIQAVGRDARGRKQYRYHPRWRTVRDEAKFGRMAAFGRALPRLRRKVETDLSRHGLTRDKVLATVVRLLEATLIRVGNEEYARENASYGLTTMLRKHVDVTGTRIEFRFRGKGGKDHEVGLSDLRLSRLLRRLQELPGQELFQYVDARGRRRTIESEDVNAYLRAATGQDFTAKDFRTWAATLRAAWALKACAPCVRATQMKRNVSDAVKQVARRLGNTATICRRSYIHPAVLDSYLDGSLTRCLDARDPALARAMRGLRPHEREVMGLLLMRIAEESPAVEPKPRRARRQAA